jgi:hypothetical protein
MTLASQIASDVSAVFLDLDDFAVQVRRYVNGNESEQQILTGVVTWFPTEPTEERGRGTRRRGEIILSSSATVTVHDAFRIGADLAQVEAVSQKQDGAVVVSITQTIPEMRGGKTLRTGDL